MIRRVLHGRDCEPGHGRKGERGEMSTYWGGLAKRLAWPKWELHRKRLEEVMWGEQSWGKAQALGWTVQGKGQGSPAIPCDR